MDSARIVVVGCGYVGLTTGACLARLGHDVTCGDVDGEKISRLRRGEVDLREPGLGELLAEGVAAGRLRFTEDSAQPVTGAEFVFLCLPTPRGVEGEADLSAVDSVVGDIRALLPPGAVVVAKSTVPVGTARRLARSLAREDVAVVSNPEFLREGRAVEDFLHPDRIVVGADDQRAAERVAGLYASVQARAELVDSVSAEVVKYASNGYLATKLSYVNDLAELCEHTGADVEAVTEGMKRDHRVAPSFLSAGPGWGGSCLPKDTAALLHTAASHGVEMPLLRAAIRANGHHQARVADKVVECCGGDVSGARVGLLGLTFKAHTGDLRDSPALAVARLLAERGAQLRGYDPACAERVAVEGVRCVADPRLAAENADVLVLLTDWPEFAELDWEQVAAVIRTPVLVDARNQVDPREVARAGFAWRGTGRSLR
ncbi:UDP-glucose/GDP-mannose dehydrogenase family protein [Saccharopolyspora rhizosphaerae]|uniref:UDP-glucose 6-dehydrogenase n=1 Tax=Saccharopolyspora rhizosphaerae TaxID=2492662 RepID=A0A3R8Q097_9PSEU|nr:UDP-glucose/GDP-mannose dehydrogenase family protein [Saccharopolyspora rhizosphaerae]RRO14185.1 UDP-glucose/GDP-mannose dehydrogenase family protein [Saccharopolyspora rhizosphaerae]